MELGSGESDAIKFDNTVYETEVTPLNKDLTLGNIQFNLGTTTTFDNYYTSPYTYTWTSHIYLYQIQCPKAKCKKMNWLELDKITPCKNCGAKLKAVSEQADFEIPVSE